jgi:hypothetical protein
MQAHKPHSKSRFFGIPYKISNFRLTVDGYKNKPSALGISTGLAEPQKCPGRRTEREDRRIKKERAREEKPGKRKIYGTRGKRGVGERQRGRKEEGWREAEKRGRESAGSGQFRAK